MRFFVNLTCELSRKLRKNPQKIKILLRFLFEKWPQIFHNFWIVCADFPSLDRPCLYDLSYGRRLDPNTKAFSAAYNDAVDIANKNRLTFLALEYATNPENMRLQLFSTKENGAVDTATTIKLHFLSLKSSKNRWNLGFQPVHMRDHRNRGCRFCNNNSTSIRTP